MTFAAAIPALISGGIAERAKFWPRLAATAIIVGDRALGIRNGQSMHLVTLFMILRAL